MAKGKQSQSARSGSTAGQQAGGGGGGDDPASNKREQPLQAVVLADSFSTSFRPLTLDRPKALCPLNNVPLIQYVLEFLASNAVEEVYVVCTSDAVEDYLVQHYGNSDSHNSGVSSTSLSSPSSVSPFAVKVVKDVTLSNAGDALREIDKRNVIQSEPFVLINGDVITNVNLKEAILAHQERRKRDSAAILTMLLKPVGGVTRHHQPQPTDLPSYEYEYSPLRSASEDLVIATDPTRQHRVLLYHDTSTDATSSIPCSFFQSHPQLDVRTDLLDSGIDLCSPDVLARLADEFDYRDLRKEFVANSVAEEEEGLQNKVHAHLLESPHEYAVRLHDWSTYAAASRDLLRRWCHPVVPDQHTTTNPVSASSSSHRYRYKLQRHFVYAECTGKTKVGRSSRVIGPAMLGSTCKVGERVVLQGSVLGHLCHVDDDARIIDSHLWDGVQVGIGASVTSSILGDGCLVGDGAVVNRGCVLGAGVVIGKGCVVPEFTRLTAQSDDGRGGDGDFDDDWGDDGTTSEDGSDEASDQTPAPSKPNEESELVSDATIVGPDGKGRVWLPPSYDDSEPEDASNGGNINDSRPKFLPSSEFYKIGSHGYDRDAYYDHLRLQQDEDTDNLSEVEEEAGNPTLNPLNASDFDAFSDEGSAAFGEDSPPVVEIVGRQKGVDVVKEMKQMCLEYEPTAPIENLAIELNAFKFSQNATYSDCTTAATLAILERMNIQSSTTDGKLVADFKSHVEHWAPLFRKFSIGIEEEKSIVMALEKFATMPDEAGEYLSSGASFRFLLQTLHDEELVSEEALLSWAAARRRGLDDEVNTGARSAVSQLFALQPVQDFLEWLEDESEEGSDDDDDDDDGQSEESY